jgi:hypothetical protein
MENPKISSNSPSLAVAEEAAHLCFAVVLEVAEWACSGQVESTLAAVGRAVVLFAGVAAR